MKVKNSVLQLIKDLISATSIDCLLLYTPQNRFWLTGFFTTLGYILITKSKAIFFVDGRYFEQARQMAINVKEVRKFDSNAFEEIRKFFKEEKVGRVGFESDSLNLPYSLVKKIKEEFKEQMFVEVKTQELRMVKEIAEIEKIKRACSIADQTFLNVARRVKSGIKEKEIERMLLSEFIHQKSEGLAFHPIVVSGERGSLPHGVASDKIVREGEMVTCDLGCYWQGYCSDLTRTFVVGKKISFPLQKIHSVVRKAQEMAIKTIKEGVDLQEVDAAARQYIAKKGYGEYFVHGTGHGLGIEVHEFPFVSKKSEGKLLSGMVITVEPGIYIPNVGGVRIEDVVLVTKDGYKILTKSPRDLFLEEENK